MTFDSGATRLFQRLERASTGTCLLIGIAKTQRLDCRRVRAHESTSSTPAWASGVGLCGKLSNGYADCCTAPAGIAARSCPTVPGYQLWSGATSAEGAALQDGARNSTLIALARSCNPRPDCTGFTTAGQLVLSALGNQEVSATGGSTSNATSCEGLYTRADLLDGGMTDDLTGLEVSNDFDLDVPYYRRVPWDACKQLCISTLGCRSVSFLASEELCTLKTATCVEAGLGSGCVQRHASTGYFLQSDRAGKSDSVCPCAIWV